LFLPAACRELTEEAEGPWPVARRRKQHIGAAWHRLRGASMNRCGVREPGLDVLPVAQTLGAPPAGPDE